MSVVTNLRPVDHTWIHEAFLYDPVIDIYKPLRGVVHSLQSV